MGVFVVYSRRCEKKQKTAGNIYYCVVPAIRSSHVAVLLLCAVYSSLREIMVVERKIRVDFGGNKLSKASKGLSSPVRQ